MKKLRLFILTLIFTGLLLGCSTSKKTNATISSEPRLRHSESASKEEKSSLNEENIEKKIIFSAFLSLTVEMPDSANVHIEAIAKKYNGYINEIGTYKTIIRVKSENLNDAINDISALGKIHNKNLEGQDVTEEFSDYQIRLENSEKSRERYLELLSKAENVEAALKVEKELERLNETIDLLKGKMNRIDHLSAFSTITVNLKEKKKPGIIGYIFVGLYHSVKWLFVRN